MRVTGGQLCLISCKRAVDVKILQLWRADWEYHLKSAREPDLISS